MISNLITYDNTMIQQSEATNDNQYYAKQLSDQSPIIDDFLVKPCYNEIKPSVSTETNVEQTNEVVNENVDSDFNINGKYCSRTNLINTLKEIDQAQHFDIEQDPKKISLWYGKSSEFSSDLEYPIEAVNNQEPELYHSDIDCYKYFHESDLETSSKNSLSPYIPDIKNPSQVNLEAKKINVTAISHNPRIKATNYSESVDYGSENSSNEILFRLSAKDSDTFNPCQDITDLMNQVIPTDANAEDCFVQSCISLSDENLTSITPPNCESGDLLDLEIRKLQKLLEQLESSSSSFHELQSISFQPEHTQPISSIGCIMEDKSMNTLSFNEYFTKNNKQELNRHNDEKPPGKLTSAVALLKSLPSKIFGGANSEKQKNAHNNSELQYRIRTASLSVSQSYYSKKSQNCSDMNRSMSIRNSDKANPTQPELNGTELSKTAMTNFSTKSDEYSANENKAADLLIPLSSHSSSESENFDYKNPLLE